MGPLSWEDLSHNLTVASHFSPVVGVYNLEGSVHRGFLPRLKMLDWNQPVVISADQNRQVVRFRARVQAALWTLSPYRTSRSRFCSPTLAFFCAVAGGEGPCQDRSSLTRSGYESFDRASVYCYSTNLQPRTLAICSVFASRLISSTSPQKLAFLLELKSGHVERAVGQAHDKLAACPGPGAAGFPDVGIRVAGGVIR